MTATLSHHAFLPDMMARHHQNDLPSSSVCPGYLPHDANGFSFSPADQWTDISWAQYQTVGGAQDFHYQTPVGQTYRQASKSGAGVQRNRNAHQEFEEFALQAAALQHGSHHNSPAFSAAELASLHSEVSRETHSSNYFSNVSNNCSPSIPDMDGAYDAFGEFNMDGAYPIYPVSTGGDSPAAFSTAMSRGNSTMSNMQLHNSPTYTNSPTMDFPLFEDNCAVQAQMPQTSATGKGGRRRNQPDSNNAARSHPFYHTAQVGPDGLYHCPWENDTNGERCSHKPEKLKCNYDKCIDSHLKPYRCKMTACSDASFSSTACLLRHEREAHAMHGHGEKPFNCELESCERSIPGNGFPRHWNLCDHMSRVHGIQAKPQENEKTTKGTRKRKSTTVEAVVKKSRASKSPKKEPITPPNSASNDVDQKRRVAKLMQQLDPNDPFFYEKLNQNLTQAGIYVNKT